VVQPAVNVDDIDLMTVTSLTPAQAAMIVERQARKPVRAWWRSEPEILWLQGLGATSGQIEQLREAMRGERSSEYPNSGLGLAKVLTCAPASEWQRLANKSRDYLYLPALTTLTPDVAQALAKFGGRNLVLSGLTSLTMEEAAALAEYRPRLDTEMLAVYRLDVAQSLTKNLHGCLGLSGLTTLTPEVAQELAKSENSLCLSGLKIGRAHV
jgi:hypothetical protein